MKTGSYQFYGERMEQEGLGELYLRFERLKQKLLAEGLFDPAMKKPLPLLPRGVGIVTSSTGAVVHDICTVTWRRNPAMPLYLCPVKVQGEGAARRSPQPFAGWDRMPEAEVLIVGRGGGSMEDLWPFNEEIVARAIRQRVGRRWSAPLQATKRILAIADFAADVRAATPSAAAELACSRGWPCWDEIDQQAERLERCSDAGFQRCGSAAGNRRRPAWRLGSRNSF
ncbi:MAG: exodeoxyribonuclease VII large subunit [Lachnospiraceae bacterium]